MYTQTYKELLDWACSRIADNGASYDGAIPHDYAQHGKYLRGHGGGWTDSFFVGLINLCYAYTRDEKFLRIAERYQDFFQKRVQNDADWCAQNDIIPLDHDTGFLFKLSQIYRFKLTGDEQARQMALRAADSLCGRYNERGGFIRAFDKWSWDTPEETEAKRGKIIVDSIMNTALLFWAHQQTGDARYYEIAHTHAQNVGRHIVRPDGSTFHNFQFDPDSGAPLYGMTGQGYSDASCWARGQAWAVYGFGETYLYTGEAQFLELAERTAQYFLEHLLPMGLPPWDFACAQELFCPIDTSSAAIVLAGLVTLHRITGHKWVEEGIGRISDGLLAHCLAPRGQGWESLLLHGCIGPAYSEGAEDTIVMPCVDAPLIYADYYFLEALLRLSDDTFDKLCLC